MSCEDKKKASEVKIEISKVDANADTISSHVKNTIISKVYPKISNENAIEFLTTYGDNNPETKVLITTYIGNIELELFDDQITQVM